MYSFNVSSFARWSEFKVLKGVGINTLLRACIKLVQQRDIDAAHTRTSFSMHKGLWVRAPVCVEYLYVNCVLHLHAY